MVTVYDVHPQRLIERLAEKLKGQVAVPEFLYYVKTGAHRERPPDDPERFWYVRLASILRRAYVDGVIGVNRLARHYGGRRNRGVKPEHFRPAGRKVIRVALQELEKLGYLQKGKDGKGRVLTPKGQSLLDAVAYEVWQEQGEETKKAKAEKKAKKAEGKAKKGAKKAEEKKTAKAKGKKAEGEKAEKTAKGKAKKSTKAKKAEEKEQ